MKKKKIDLELFKKFIEEGNSRKEISEKLGVCVTTISRFSREHGIFVKQSSKNKINETNNVYGALTVIESMKSKENGFTYWKCKCLCGKECEVRATNLRRGDTTSCGCKILYKEKKKHHSYKNISASYWRNLSCRATNRKLDFTITIEYINDLLESQNFKCYFTGQEINLDNKTASLDRKDSSKGYIIDNVVWVHKDINKLKTDFSISEFIKLCNWVSDYNRGQNEFIKSN